MSQFKTSSVKFIYISFCDKHMYLYMQQEVCLVRAVVVTTQTITTALHANPNNRALAFDHISVHYHYNSVISCSPQFVTHYSHQICPLPRDVTPMTTYAWQLRIANATAPKFLYTLYRVVAFKNTFIAFKHYQRQSIQGEDREDYPS